MTFAEKLKELMCQKGLSDRTLAEEIKTVSKSTVNVWRQGKIRPNLVEAVWLADFFDVDVEYLARDEVTTRRARKLSEDERCVLDVYHTIGITKSEALRRLVRPLTSGDCPKAGGGTSGIADVIGDRDEDGLGTMGMGGDVDQSILEAKGDHAGADPPAVPPRRRRRP
jgi:transcriptional regulator with XRE-family HTH domain